MWTSENRAKYNRDHLRYPSDVTDAEWAVGGGDNAQLNDAPLRRSVPCIH